MTAPTIVALVPARAGSRRIQGKNLRPLGGHPLIAYTLGAARESGVFESVIVSTDSPQIADVARGYGAEVPFLRPESMAGEHSPDIEWLDHTLAQLGAGGRSWQCFSILRPTSPFRQPATIRRAWERFKEHPDADSLRAVERCRQHPMKMWVVEDPFMRPLISGGPTDPPWHSTPYQSLPPVYAQNASLEIAWSRVVTEDHSIAGARVLPFFSNGAEGFDINDRYDLIVAEEMVRSGEAQLPPIRMVSP